MLWSGRRGASHIASPDNYRLLRDWRHSYRDRRPIDRRHIIKNFLAQCREHIEFMLDASQPMQDFLVFVQTGVTVIDAAGLNVAGVPASVNG